MGVLHSIPLCARGNNQAAVEPLDLDKNNNEAAAVVVQQPPQQILAHAPPEATSTPRPQSPVVIGLANDHYSDSLANSSSDSAEAEVEDDEGPEAIALSDSGLEESATEFEYTRGGGAGSSAAAAAGQADLSCNLDEGVHEEFDDTLVITEEIDLNDSTEDVNSGDPLERPPEPTVPDERVSSDEESSSINNDQDNVQEVTGKPNNSETQTQRKISNLLSELVGDHPAGEHATRPDLVPMR